MDFLLTVLGYAVSLWIGIVLLALVIAIGVGIYMWKHWE